MKKEKQYRYEIEGFDKPRVSWGVSGENAVVQSLRQNPPDRIGELCRFRLADYKDTWNYWNSLVALKNAGFQVEVQK